MNRRTPPTFSGAMNAVDAHDLADALSLLADASRLQIISILHTEPGTCSEDIAVQIRRSQPVACHHVRKLRAAGLVTHAVEGPFKPLRLDEDALAAVADRLRAVAR